MNNEQTNEKTFLLSESVFAWLCYIAGYAFCRCFPVMDYPLGGFLFILALFTATIIFFIIKKRKFLGERYGYFSQKSIVFRW